MRNMLFGAGIAIYAVAQVLSALLSAVLLFGGATWLFLAGYAVFAIALFLLAPVVVLLAVSVVRLPFVLLGALLAAMAGRWGEYWDLVAESNQ